MHLNLVEAARAGDHEAFEVLAAAAVDRLYAIARLVLHDAHDAEDAVQEALIDAWRNLPGLRDPSRWDAWLRRLLLNVCMDEGRHRGRFQATVRLLREEPSEPDGSAQLADREQLERGFRRLKPEHRAAVVLHFYLGLPFQDVADTLGIPIGTAKSRVHYATAILRAALEADARGTVTTNKGLTG